MKPSWFKALLIMLACLAAGRVFPQFPQLNGRSNGQRGAQLGPQPAVQPRLKGIVHWMSENRALLEVPGRSGRPITDILRVGERGAGCEILMIDEKAGRVKFVSGRPRETNEVRLAMKPEDAVAGRTFAFQSARLHQVLEIYQEVCGRTVIAPVGLPDTAFDLMSGPRLSAIEATDLLDQAFAARGLFTMPRGAKFVFVVPQRQLELPGRLREPPPAEVPPNAEVLPAGLVQFRDAECRQVLDIYAELSGRDVLHPSPLRERNITVKSQTPLTRSEAVWLLDSLLLLAGLNMAPEADKFVYAVPLNWSEPLPKFNSRAAVARLGDVGIPGGMRFIDADREQILEAYAALLERKPLPPGAEVPPAKLNFQAQQRLTRAEAIFALEALAALNNLGFELVGSKQVKLVPAVAAPQ